MGRYDTSNKTKIVDTKTISVNFLKKNDYFCGYNSGTITWTRSGFWGEQKSSVSIVVTVNDTVKQLNISYTQTDRDSQERKSFDYKIPLTSTPCRFGGKRWWFICPWYRNGIYCGRRVGKLYKDGDYFACRHCNDLTYESKSKNRRWKYAPLFNACDIEDKINELTPKIKRTTHIGKPTKKYRKLLRMYDELDRAYVRAGI